MRALLLFAPLVFVTVTGCKPTAAEPAAAPSASASSASAPAAPSAPAIRPEGPVGDLLEAYEGARSKLAADDFAGAQPFAAAMGAAARVAAEHAVTAKPTFDAVIAGTDQMVAAKDIGAMRLAYGDVSKHVITLLVADAELRTGRHLMLCPMAKGYQKWVQTTAKLTNPYFGKEMLECGEELKVWSI